jgi:hypothetical protein
MESEPTREGLLELLTDLGQTELYNQLLNAPRLFTMWKKRTEGQWKEIAGVAVGIDIYNYLHPRSEGIL